MKSTRTIKTAGRLGFFLVAVPSGGILLVGVGLGRHCPWPLNADPLDGTREGPKECGNE
jgi:hypothetical protein